MKGVRHGILQIDTFTARPLEVLPLFFFFGSGSPLRQSLGSNDGPRFLDAVLELGRSLLSYLAELFGFLVSWSGHLRPSSSAFTKRICLLQAIDTLDPILHANLRPTYWLMNIPCFTILQFIPMPGCQQTNIVSLMIFMIVYKNPTFYRIYDQTQRCSGMLHIGT